MSGFAIEGPGEWQDSPFGPWDTMVHRVYVPAEDADQAGLTYLEYRDGSDEHGLNMLRTGRVCRTLEQANDCVTLAQTQGRELTVFRALGGLA